jgi:hypothetical protein
VNWNQRQWPTAAGIAMFIGLVFGKSEIGTFVVAPRRR